MTMNTTTRLGRIFLCGLVAGVLWFALSAIALSVVGRDFLAAVQVGRQPVPRAGLFFFAIDLAMGVWAMWLYACIHTNYRSASRAAAVVGFAWWFIKSLQSAKWVALGFVPPEVTLAPLVVTLPLPILAVLVGAWLYGDRANLPALQSSR